MLDAIPKTASENQKHDRSAIASRQLVDRIANLWQAAERSERRKQSMLYAFRAASVLCQKRQPAGPAKDTRFSWLVADDAQIHCLTVLAELGRIGDVETLRSFAAKLCAMTPPPSVEQATSLVRQWRCGHTVKGSAAG